MLNRVALLATARMLSLAVAPRRSRWPTRRRRTPPSTPVGTRAPPPDNGVVGSSEPGVVTTPDGWTLTVVAPTRPNCRSRR